MTNLFYFYFFSSGK